MSIAIWFVDRLHSSGTMISMAAVHYVMAFVIYRRVSEISSFVTIAWKLRCASHTSIHSSGFSLPFYNRKEIKETLRWIYTSDNRDMTIPLVWLSQQLIPPLLLTYFFVSWRVATFELAPSLSSDVLAWSQPDKGNISIFTNDIKRIIAYNVICSLHVLPTLLIGSITVLYLRLYLLPRSQSVPPYDPPLEVLNKRVMFACFLPQSSSRSSSNLELEPESGDVLLITEQEPEVERCYKGRCGGRWKPARTRHCTQCGVCRAGFDHHCPFFANCLTAPYIPTFLAVLLYTPPTVLILSFPLLPPLFHRSIAAYLLACDSSEIIAYWWNWKWSWVVAGGPVGRFAGGIILGWRELDTQDGGGLYRLTVGLLVAFGFILSGITAGLAYSTIQVLRDGDFAIDRERSGAHRRILSTIKDLPQEQPIPDKLRQDLARFSDRPAFYLPPSNTDQICPDKGQDRKWGRHGRKNRNGCIVQLNDKMRPYDHGPRVNTQLVLGTPWGEGWGWLLPWRAIRRSIGYDQGGRWLFNWPVAEGVRQEIEGVIERGILNRQSEGYHIDYR
ncbi:hypothetical protein C367_04747 [Cryptococcus neoformans Ze90-1]|nr:hypothetical protein C367_04747 [Cryptococcus neoformans var. grubii Ze90-1]